MNNQQIAPPPQTTCEIIEEEKEKQQEQQFCFGHTYSPCMQMVSFPNAISYAHSMMMLMIVFCRTLCTLVAYFSYEWLLFVVLSTFEDRHSILAWWHPMQTTSAYPAAVTVNKLDNFQNTFNKSMWIHIFKNNQFHIRMEMANKKKR